MIAGDGAGSTEAVGEAGGGGAVSRDDRGLAAALTSVNHRVGVSDGLVTVQAAPAGSSLKKRDTVPAAVPAGIRKAKSYTTPPQATKMAMSPCWPAAGPAMVLLTCRDPGVDRYTSIRPTTTTSPAGTVTFWLLPVTVTVTVEVALSEVSVTVQTEPAGMLSKLWTTVPGGAGGDGRSRATGRCRRTPRGIVTGSPWLAGSTPAMPLVGQQGADP